MGALCASPPKEQRVLMLGLDAAGKTTILYRLKRNEVVTTVPTVGFNVESITHKSLNFAVWDIGGQDKIRSLWRHYYDGAAAIVFVVDSADAERLDDSKGYENSASNELARLLAEEQLRNCPLLIFANKQDAPTAMKLEDVAEALQTRKIQHRPWHVQGCCGLTGVGLTEGLDWLSTQVEKANLLKK